jgi:hypothetical protein
VSYTASDSFHAGRPRAWADTAIAARGAGQRFYDIHPDGVRVAVGLAGTATRGDRVVLNVGLFHELRRLAAVK